MGARAVAAALVVVVTALGTGVRTSPAVAMGGQHTVARVVSGRTIPVPSGLPGHFGFGVAAGPGSDVVTGWMPASGVPWDYAYTYLAGGVNTGQGWQTWNTNAQYPLWYAQASRAHGYIPTLPYYMLLQSTGPCDSCPEPQRDLSNLASSG